MARLRCRYRARRWPLHSSCPGGSRYPPRCAYWGAQERPAPPHQMERAGPPPSLTQGQQLPRRRACARAAACPSQARRPLRRAYARPSRPGGRRAPLSPGRVLRRAAARPQSPPGTFERAAGCRAPEPHSPAAGGSGRRGGAKRAAAGRGAWCSPQQLRQIWQRGPLLRPSPASTGVAGAPWRALLREGQRWRAAGRCCCPWWRAV